MVAIGDNFTHNMLGLHLFGYLYPATSLPMNENPLNALRATLVELPLPLNWLAPCFPTEKMLVLNSPIGEVICEFRPNLKPFYEVYRDLHQHPELSCQESRTASLAAAHFRSLGFSVVENVGGHGVVCTFQNGSGPAVLLRAEMDALPVRELTELPYASKVRMIDTDGIEKPVMHACGHDMHVACLMATATLLQSAREKWSGTLICVFQPNEERGGGAKAMIDDGLYSKGYVPKPDVVLAQHVVNIKAGHVATRTGHTLAGKNVFKVQIYGRGGHGSAPQDCIDPIVIGAHIVVRLQSIISRELDPNKMALITCGSLHSGDAPNIIPDETVLMVDIRAYNSKVLAKLVVAFKRVVKAECDAAGAVRSPDITEIEAVPPLRGWPEIMGPITRNFKSFFRSWVEEMEADPASDDFSLLAPEGVPYAYWNFGSSDHKIWDIAKRQGKLNEVPGNHSAYYAPLIEPTLRTGTDAMAIAALTFLELV